MTEHILLYSPACNSGFNIFHVIEGQNFHWNYKQGFCSFSFSYIFWVSYTCIWWTLNTWSHLHISPTIKIHALKPTKWFVWPPNSIQKNQNDLFDPPIQSKKIATNYLSLLCCIFRQVFPEYFIRQFMVTGLRWGMSSISK